LILIFSSIIMIMKIICFMLLILSFCVRSNHNRNVDACTCCRHTQWL
jgi:hypothetical protein